MYRNCLLYTSQLIAAAIEYQLDGLNIDFEELSGETGEHFIEFIRELSIKCRANGIVPVSYTHLDVYKRQRESL